MGPLQWLAVGLVAWTYVGVKRRADPNVIVCSLLIALGLVNYLFQKAGAGVQENALFELVFGVSVGVGLAFAQEEGLLLFGRRQAPEALRFALLLAICLRLVASTRLEPVRLLADPSFHREIAMREAAMTATVARIRATPGDVLCSNLACYRSGKPFAVDVFNCGQRIKTGQLPPDAITGLIANGRLTVVDQDPLLSW